MKSPGPYGENHAGSDSTAFTAQGRGTSGNTGAAVQDIIQ
ncbi:hypothetical protein RK21_02492 [Pseudomonas plecoglossicida]|nr:hypothetical protein RK21_02492 [Pseudomonas plecoglossicida]